MLAIDTIVGNVDDDPELARRRDDHATAGTLERVEIDSEERFKSRLRTTTDADTDVGIVVDRPELRDGDVLAAGDDRMIVVRFADREAFVIELPDDTTLETALELGHRVGNQHWDLSIEGTTAYVPLDADRRIVEDVLDDALPSTATTAVETVDASLFVDGDAPEDHVQGSDDHAHVHDDDHAHVHGDDHVHHDPNHDHENRTSDHGGSHERS